MATASTSANDLTRQQLDELDSLLQRMLALPINPSEPTPPPLAAETVAAFAPPLPPVALVPQTSFAPAAPQPVHRRQEAAVPSPRLFAPPVEETVRFETPLPSRPNSVTIPEPQREEPRIPVPAAVVPVTPPLTVPQEDEEPGPFQFANELPFAQPEPEIATPRAEPVSLLAGPFVFFNRVLNSALGLLGWPGYALRSGLVKNGLGLSGLGLLAYTGLKVAQVHGWVSLPVELPWPR